MSYTSGLIGAKLLGRASDLLLIDPSLATPIYIEKWPYRSNIILIVWHFMVWQYKEVAIYLEKKRKKEKKRDHIDGESVLPRLRLISPLSPLICTRDR